MKNLITLRISFKIVGSLMMFLLISEMNWSQCPVLYMSTDNSPCHYYCPGETETFRATLGPTSGRVWSFPPGCVPISTPLDSNVVTTQFITETEGCVTCDFSKCYVTARYPASEIPGAPSIPFMITICDTTDYTIFESTHYTPPLLPVNYWSRLRYEGIDCNISFFQIPIPSIYYPYDSVVIKWGKGGYGMFILSADSFVCGHSCSSDDTLMANLYPAPDLDGPRCVMPGDTCKYSSPGNLGKTFSWTAVNGTITALSSVTTSAYVRWDSLPGMIIISESNGCATVHDTIVVDSGYAEIDLPATGKICPGGAKLLGAGGIGDNWLWSTGATSPTIWADTPGVYSVTVTDSLGCSDWDASSLSWEESVHGRLGADQLWCYPDTTTLLSPSYSGMVYHSWLPGGSTAGSLSVSSSGTYILMGMTLSSCTTYDTIHVLFDKPFSGLPTDTAACIGDIISLDATGNGVSWLWSTGSTSPVIDATFASDWAVSITDSLGCSITDTVSVIYSPLIHGALGPDVTVCPPDYVLDAGVWGVTSYLWSDGTTSMTDTITSSGIYSVTATAPGCISSDTIEVDFYPLTCAFSSSSVGGLIMSFSELATNESSYSWDFGDGTPLSSFANPTHGFPAFGDYTVCLTVNGVGGCSLTTCDTVHVGPLMHSYWASGEPLHSVYPNPAFNFLNVAKRGNYLPQSKVELRDLTGNLVHQWMIQGNEIEQFYVGNLPAGVYFIEIYEGPKVFSGQITIQHE